MSFGLVNIPVKLYSASQERALSFRMLDKNDHCPVTYLKVCREDNQVIDQKDVVKAYEYKKGQYVILTPEDFEKARAKKSEVIDIVHFSDEDDIDRRLYEKPYFIEPDKKAGKAYALLREALRKTGKVGVARFVMHEREHLGVIKAGDRFLMLDQLRYQDELRSDKDLAAPARADHTKKELDLALSLIDSLSEKFDPKDYKDTYTDELKRIIAAKSKGKPVKVDEPEEDLEPTDVSDILSALERSLERVPAR